MNQCTIVMYHYVRSLKDSRYPEIKGLDLKLFKQQIAFLKCNYNIITTEELLLAATDKFHTLPENAMLLTFDDGYIDHFTNVFPVLKEHKLQGFFSMPSRILCDGKLLDVNKIHFILASANIGDLLQEVLSKLDFYRGNEFDYPYNDELFKTLGVASRYDSEKIVFIKTILQNYLPLRLRNIIVDELFRKYIPITESDFAKELYMSYDQIKLMKNEGMYFGLHGHDHFWLGKMEMDEMKRDIINSMNFFSDLIDRDNWIMCYPYGSHNPKVLEFIKNNGCKLGLTTEVMVANLSDDNPLLLPRLDTNDFPPKSENYKNSVLSGI